MSDEKAMLPVERIERLIYLIRGQKVMLDADLAEIYGVTTKRLNEQVGRNAGRFPSDFAFLLTRQEVANLKSQIATSSLEGRSTSVGTYQHGGRRKLPYVFTEHGAIMLASVLNSPVAVQASVRVVRAFVRLREMLASNRELSQKLTELERKFEGHDDAIRNLFEAIRQLLSPPDPKHRKIGFHVKERSAKYRLRQGSRIEPAKS
jgi:ORF6N domain-containing protein